MCAAVRWYQHSGFLEVVQLVFSPFSCHRFHSVERLNEMFHSICAQPFSVFVALLYLSEMTNHSNAPVIIARTAANSTLQPYFNA